MSWNRENFDVGHLPLPIKPRDDIEFTGNPVLDELMELRKQSQLEVNRQMIEDLCKELNVPHQILVGAPPPPAKFIGGGSTLHFRKGDYEITVDFPHSPGMSMKKVQDFWSLQLDHFIEYMTNPIKVQGEEFVMGHPISKEGIKEVEEWITTHLHTDPTEFITCGPVVDEPIVKEMK